MRTLPLLAVVLAMPVLLAACESPTASAPAAASPRVAPPTASDPPEVTTDETKLRESAQRKREGRDGPGCIADFDEADKKYPSSPRLSTRPDGMMNMRAECLMLAGDCESGRKLLRQAYERLGMKPDQIDLLVKVSAADLCPKKK